MYINLNSDSKTVLRISILSFALTLGASMSAQADNWQTGNVITYTQSDWAGGDPTARSILFASFNTVYFSTGGVLQVGAEPGHTAEFTGANYVDAFLPSEGAEGAALNANLVNPTTSAAGLFTGDVIALKLDIDYSAAGVILGNSNIAFGSLTLENYADTKLDGLSVNQFYSDANSLLSGQTAGGLTIDEVGTVIGAINASFENGTVTTFAQDYLFSPTSSGGGTISPAPEIDSSGFVVNITMLLGGLQVMRGKRRLEF